MIEDLKQLMSVEEIERRLKDNAVERALLSQLHRIAINMRDTGHPTRPRGRAASKDSAESEGNDTPLFEGEESAPSGGE